VSVQATPRHADTLHINNSTIASNQAQDGGGGVYQEYTNGRGTSARRCSARSWATTRWAMEARTTPRALISTTSVVPFDLSFSLVEQPRFAAQPEPGGFEPDRWTRSSVRGQQRRSDETQLPSINSPVVDKGKARPAT
jgi:hypothetical protein